MMLKGSLYVLHDFIKREQPVTITKEKLAEETGYEYKTVSRGLQRLVRDGLIEAEPISGRGPSTYQVAQ